MSSDQSEETTQKQRTDVPASAGGAAVQPGAASTGPKAIPTRWVLGLLVIFVAAALGAGAYWIWGQYRAQSEQISARLGGIAEQLAAMEKDLSSQSETTRQDRSEIQALQQEQNAFKDSLAKMYMRARQGPGEWTLAEVEYLLSIASQRLALESDVATALAALEAADARLRDLGDPDLIPIRGQLVKDMNRLRAVKTVDVTGLALYLADLESRAAELPLKQTVLLKGSEPEPPEGTEETQTWRSLISAIWNELKTLVVVRNDAADDSVFLLPEQRYFLYQNLRLELESARLSVLRRDTANLRASLAAVRDWLTLYFNVKAPAVANVLETVEQMATLDLAPTLPDISSSLTGLRSYLEQKEGETTGASPNLEEPAS